MLKPGQPDHPDQAGTPYRWQARDSGHHHFVSDLIPGLDQAIAEHSIYAYIEQTLNLQISYAQRTIEAVPRSKDDQQHLDLDGQSHVIVVSNQTFLQDGRQFEYTESRHSLDKFYFSDVARRDIKSTPALSRREGAPAGGAAQICFGF
jgi:hypothetical protein